MAKNLSNLDIRAYEGSDFAKIEDNYTDRQVQVAIANRTEKLIEHIEQMENNPDVSDIVDTYADLQAYDTSTLTDKDIIRVLNDETHNGESTYYRYSKTTETWTYIGSTGPKFTLSDWAENDSTNPAFIKNRTHYEKIVDNTISQYGSTSAGSTSDPDYVWFIEKVESYALSDNLDVEDGDTVYMDITYSANGNVQTDSGKFTVSIEDGNVNLDSVAEPGNRWRGAYASEIDGDTTFRWPVPTVDSSSTVYITGLSYQTVRELDAKYIPVDGETIIVNTDGRLEVASGGTVSQLNATIDAINSALNTNIPHVGV